MWLRAADGGQAYADNATCAVENGMPSGCDRNSKCSTCSTRENPAASAVRSCPCTHRLIGAVVAIRRALPEEMADGFVPSRCLQWGCALRPLPLHSSGSNRFGILAPRSVDRRQQRRRLLRTRHGEPAVENEEGNAAHADVERLAAFVRNHVAQRIGVEHRTCVVFGEPCFRCEPREFTAVADESAFEKVGTEKPLDERIRVASLLGPGDQPMRIARVRLQRYSIDVERDPDTLAGLAHANVAFVGARDTAPFVLEILGTRNALRRQIRVELERVPANGDIDRRLRRSQLRERNLELALADEAPRAHDIRDDVDDKAVRVVHRDLLLVLHSAGARRESSRPSNTALTFVASAANVNGFVIRSTPGS